MVIYKKGNLLEEEGLFAICHQTNCQSKMKAGLAKSIVEYYPNVAEVDRNCKLSPKERLGKFSFSLEKYKNRTPLMIFNLYGQFYYGTDSVKTNYHELENAFIAMTSYINYYIKYYISSGIVELIPNEIKIGIPYKIGCGLAGGDWNIVKDIIEKVFDNEYNKRLIGVVLDNN